VVIGHQKPKPPYLPGCHQSDPSQTLLRNNIENRYTAPHIDKSLNDGFRAKSPVGNCDFGAISP
jgi:hypothetical protein